jgi:hypothetical protein
VILPRRRRRSGASIRTTIDVYEAGSLRFAPSRTTVPLLVDHDDDQEIGTVPELFTMDWVDGPPGSAQRRPSPARPAGSNGAPGVVPGIRLSAAKLERLRARATDRRRDRWRGLGVASGVDPAEPCAEVLLYRRAEERAADAEVFYGGAVLRGTFPGTFAIR